jgi:hypothetical protein
MFKNLNIGTRLVLSYLVMAAIVCLTGLLAIFYVSSVGKEGVMIGEQEAPLSDAAMEIKLSAATAHLYFEEIMSGDEGEDVNKIYDMLGEAMWYCDAILNGGKNAEGTYVATDNPDVRAKILQTKAMLERFRESAKRRYAQRGTAGPGTQADIDFDREFTDFVKMADDAETAIHNDMRDSLASLRSYSSTAVIMMTVSMLSGVALALVVGFVMGAPSRARSCVWRSSPSASPTATSPLRAASTAKTARTRSRSCSARSARWPTACASSWASSNPASLSSPPARVRSRAPRRSPPPPRRSSPSR